MSNIPAAATNIIKVSAGNTHMMALRADGQVFAWGYGALDTNRLPAVAWFEWGATTNLGNVTATQNLSTNLTSGLLNAMIMGLLPGTKYYCRLVVSNVDGIHSGGVQPFTTTQIIAPLLSAALFAGNSLQINFAGNSGASYAVYASTNLTHWVLVGQASALESNRFQFVDSLTSNYPARFYRVSNP